MNVAENNRLLLDCYLSGQVPENEWTEHLKDLQFAKFVASEMGVAKPEPAPTLGARDRAYQKFMADSGTALALKTAHDSFKAGWNAHKQLSYEIAHGLKLLALPLEPLRHVRPLHSSAYEPLTPFKPGPVKRPTNNLGS
jgi:hypothetical protein